MDEFKIVLTYNIPDFACGNQLKISTKNQHGISADYFILQTPKKSLAYYDYCYLLPVD
jgi:hypothetical protein